MYPYVLLGLVMGLVARLLEPGGPAPQTARLFLGMTVLVVGVLLAGVALSVLILRRQGSLELDEQRFLRSVGRVGRIYRLVVLGAYAVMLFALHWPAWVVHASGKSGLALVEYGLVALPLLVLLAVSWTALYWADRNLRAVMFARAGVVTVAGQWTLPRYLEFMFRQYVVVFLVPLLALLAVEDAVAYYVGSGEVEVLQVPCMIAAVVVAILLSGPWMRFCWRTERLPSSELRDRLTALIHRARIGIRNILVWRTNLSIVNGCMVGALGPLRYILITDALLVSLPPEEVEAVFAHEVGHVKLRHVLLYVVLALGGMSLIAVLGDWVLTATEDAKLVTMVIAALSLAYWWLIFGYISRRCELESDLYAVELIACPEGCPSTGSFSSEEGRAAGSAGAPGICQHRVAVFASALRRIARLNGTAETSRGWRHFSIARRCQFLEALAEDPGRIQAFRRKMRSLRIAALVASGIALAAAGLIGFPGPSEPDHPENPARPQNVRPWKPSQLAGLIDRNEMDGVALGAPQLDSDTDVAAHLDDGRLAGLGDCIAAAHHDVAVEDPRGHAAPVDAKGERPRRDRPEPGEVDELDDAVARRLR